MDENSTSADAGLTSFAGVSWRVRRRTNRLLDVTGGGRRRFGDSLRAVFGEGPR